MQATYGGGSASICGAGLGRSSLNGESVNKEKIIKLIKQKNELKKYEIKRNWKKKKVDNKFNNNIIMNLRKFLNPGEEG